MACRYHAIAKANISDIADVKCSAFISHSNGQVKVRSNDPFLQSPQGAAELVSLHRCQALIQTQRLVLTA